MIDDMKEYIKPAIEQMAATIETFIAESIQISTDSHDGVSGDTKESTEWDEDWE